MARRRTDTRTVEPQKWFAELPSGLEEFGVAELKRLGATSLTRAADGVRFGANDPARALRARCVTALYHRLSFNVPRPKALLGDAVFRRLTEAVIETAGAHGGGTPLSGAAFDGLRLAGAGADSPVMTRLGQELAKATGLGYDPRQGELLLRLRPDPIGHGWEALVRLTPRPLTTRAWRVCNRAGGLNAAVAAAMNELTGIGKADRYLNLMSGSGTLLIERALRGPAARLVGVDLDPGAQACAQRNAAAANVQQRCDFLTGDVRQLSAAQLGTFDVITADAPWGDAVGRHADNRHLYPLLLVKAAELAPPPSRFVLLTHEVKLTQQLLPQQTEWRVRRQLRVAHGGHQPLLVLLERAG